MVIFHSYVDRWTGKSQEFTTENAAETHQTITESPVSAGAEDSPSDRCAGFLAPACVGRLTVKTQNTWRNKNSSIFCWGNYLMNNFPKNPHGVTDVTVTLIHHGSNDRNFGLWATCSSPFRPQKSRPSKRKGLVARLDSYREEYEECIQCGAP